MIKRIIVRVKMVSRQEGTGFIAQKEIVFNKLTNSPSTKQMRKRKV